MSPFTPFSTEQMYQNLRRCQPQGEAPESVHYCDFPTAQEPYAGDAQIQLSVERMQTVIELSRTIRWAECLVYPHHCYLNVITPLGKVHPHRAMFLGFKYIVNNTRIVYICDAINNYILHF